MTAPIKSEEVVGKTYGRLTIRRVYQTEGRSVARCDCSCGKRHAALLNSIRSGNATSCGCKRAASNRARIKPTILTLHGRSQRVADWARELGIPKDTIHRRIGLGMSPERALCTTDLNRGRGHDLLPTVFERRYGIKKFHRKIKKK